MDVPGGAGAGATQKPSQQNEASRLQEQDCTEPPPPGEPSGLDITCAMEFLEEFVELLAQPLRTLPSIGPPAALAYRPEVLRGCLRAEAEEDCAPKCEYCGSVLRPFPSFEDICPPPQKFCCQRNRDLYEFILNERKKHESARDSSISIESHKPHGSDAERHQEKERAYQRYCDGCGDSWDHFVQGTGCSGGKRSAKKMRPRQEGMKELFKSQAHIPSGPPQLFSYQPRHRWGPKCNSSYGRDNIWVLFLPQMPKQCMNLYFSVLLLKPRHL